MRKILCLLAAAIWMMPLQPLQAAPSQELLEDALYSVLFPKMNEALEKHYGTLRKYDCIKIAGMKKVYSGTYVFQAKIEMITYTGAPGEAPKPPFEKAEIPFSNEEGEWTAGPVQTKRLPDNTKLQCRKPV